MSEWGQGSDQLVKPFLFYYMYLHETSILKIKWFFTLSLETILDRSWCKPFIQYFTIKQWKIKKLMNFTAFIILLITEMITSYIQLQNAIEVLCQVLPWSSFKTFIPFCLKKQAVSLKSFQKLLVEVVYILYYLHLNGSSCSITKQLFLNKLVNEEQQAVLAILLQQDNNSRKDESREGLINKYFMAVDLQEESKAVDAIIYFVEIILERYQDCQAKGFILITPINKAIMKAQMEQFVYVYTQVIKPQILKQKALSALLRGLEQTRLFRQNAFVLKYSNNSIICKININQKCKEQLKTSISQFQKQRLYFLQQKRNVEGTDAIIQKVFKKMITNNIISVMLSTESQQNMQSQLANYESVKISKVLQSKQIYSRAVTLNINVEQNSYQFLKPQKFAMILSNPEHQFVRNKLIYRRIHQFDVIYWNVDNQIMLKLTTDYAVRIHQIEIITNILNSINLDSISFSFIENTKKVKSNQKAVVLTTRVQLHPKENPFLSIFLCMDKLIIACLVVQHDVRLRNQVNVRRREQICQTYKNLIVKMEQQWNCLAN